MPSKKRMRFDVLFKSGVEKTYFGEPFDYDPKIHDAEIERIKGLVNDIYKEQLGGHLAISSTIVNVGDTSCVSIYLVNAIVV